MKIFLMSLLTVARVPLTCVAQSDVSSRMYKGERVRHEHYPFFAHVKVVRERMKADKCSGALISKKWVITSGACVSNISAGSGRGVVERVIVKFMLNDNGTNAASAQTKDFIIHPHFNVERVIDKGLADVALLRMPDEFISPVKPITLPDVGEDKRLVDRFTQVFIVAGGLTLPGDPEGGDYTLKEAYSYLHQIRCYFNATRHINIAYQTCVRSVPKPTHKFLICKGDSGSPVMNSFPNVHGERVITAIVPAGVHACTRQPEEQKWVVTPLTRTAPLIPWILHSIDRHTESHDHEALMDQWMSHFQILSNHMPAM